MLPWSLRDFYAAHESGCGTTRTYMDVGYLVAVG